MADPARLLLTNAAAAGLIALFAWGASRVLRRHAVVHALWLLALLKLVSPPVAPLRVLPSWTGEPLAFAPRTPTVAVIPAPLGTDALLRSRAATGELATVERARTADTARVLAFPPSRNAAAGSTRPATPSPLPDWRAAAWTVLAAGALAIGGLAAWRFRRFGRLLACARPAPEGIAERASTLASQLGLRRAPRVLLLPARVPPMLWPGRGGPLLLMPERLTAELGADELDALLAHELAHVRRRDHWVRLVEIAATALFWWYPVTWWARRALRRAEERCCDEWVLRVLPRSARAYASGLLKSLTFVADTPVPALASGLGPVEDLEARLKEILMTRPAPQLAVPLRLGLAVAAVLGLAIFPTHAEPRAGAADDPARPAPVAEKASTAKTAPASQEASSAPDATAPETVEDGVKGGVVHGVPAGVRGGVPGGVVGGVPGGVAAGVPAGIPGGVNGGIAPGAPTPPPAPPLTPLPALAPAPGAALPGVPLPPPAVAPLAGPMAVPPVPPQPVHPLAATPAIAPMAPLGPVPPVLAVAAPPTPRSPEQRALDDQRRAIQDQQRKLQQQQLELEQKQLELQAQAEQAELQAEADRLRADGKADEALRVEKRAQMSSRRIDLQKRQLELEAERAALEAKLDAEMDGYQDRVEAAGNDGQEKALEDAQREMERAQAAREHSELELETKEKALQEQMEQFEKQEQALAVEEQVRSLRGATEELARSIGEQIASLKQARAEAPAHRAEFDREIQRLQAALDALSAGATPKPQAPKAPRPPAKTPRP
jgi:beta-lactamase regulating signal transducer with metallopeptidase domain